MRIFVLAEVTLVVTATLASASSSAGIMTTFMGLRILRVLLHLPSVLPDKMLCFAGHSNMLVVVWLYSQVVLERGDTI